MRNPTVIYRYHRDIRNAKHNDLSRRYYISNRQATLVRDTYRSLREDNVPAYRARRIICNMLNVNALEVS